MKSRKAKSSKSYFGTTAGIRKYRWRWKEFQELAQAFAANRKEKQMQEFLLDILTHREIAELIRRFQAARILVHGGTFDDVGNLLGMSPHTTTRINEALDFGKGGLRRALK